MKHKWAFSLLLSVAVLSCSLTVSAKDKPIKADVKDANGKSLGWAMIKSAGQGVEVKLTLHDLPPGEHAVHFHQNASCEAPDFKSAGAHFNPDSKQHGLENPDGHHAGDMINFMVDAKGNADVALFDKDVTLGGGSHSLFSNGGTAIVVHAKADDLKSDPSGNSGDRIACAAIKK